MVHQTAENLTVTNVLGSSPQIFSGELHPQFSSSTNLKRTLKSQAQVLYVQIKDEVADEIIKHGLSKVESKLFFYFLKLDRFGDRPVKVKVAEILLATGGDTKWQFRILLVTLKTYWTKKHGFLVFCGL